MSVPKYLDTGGREINAEELKEILTSTVIAVDIEASPDSITFVTQDAFDTIKRYNASMTQGVHILGTQTLRAFANDIRYTALFIDELNGLTTVVEEPKTHDIKREAKRLRQAEAKLARQRQIKARGGKR